MLSQHPRSRILASLLGRYQRDTHGRPTRGGPFCNNNLYMAALVLPVVALVPMLIARFSFLLPGVFVALVALLLFRYSVIFRKVGCLHCCGKQICPQAEQVGSREL